MMLLSHFIVIVKFKKSRRQKLHEKVPKYITAEIYYRRNLKPPKYITNKVYIKPTNLGIFLNFNSHHPKNIILNTAKNELKRALDRCSTIPLKKKALVGTPVTNRKCFQ